MAVPERQQKQPPENVYTPPKFEFPEIVFASDPERVGERLAQIGEVFDGKLYEEQQAVIREKQKSPLQRFLENREKVNSAAILDEIYRKTRFDPLPHNVRIPHHVMEKFMTLKRRLRNGNEETISQKLEKERAKGEEGAAVAGTAHIGRRTAAGYLMRYDFWAGSFGVYEGTLFGRIARLASKRKIPFFGVYASSGVRQPENYAGVRQMRRANWEAKQAEMAASIPHIAVLAGEVWGGISASVVGRATLKIAFKGTNTGFTGPRLIEKHTGKKVPPGAQSAEMHTLYRNVDIMVGNVDQLLTTLNGVYEVAYHQRRKNKIVRTDMSRLRPARRLSRSERFYRGEDGFSNFLFDQPKSQGEDELPKTRKDVIHETLAERLTAIESNSNRPDTEFLMRTCFENVTPLYSRFVLGKEIRYPAIIASLGYIGDQPYLIVGNQPSYEVNGDYFKKIGSAPAPEDYDYMRRMLELGETLGVPAIFFTDTAGASPTLEAEIRDQSGAISRALEATDGYRYPTISIVIGQSGSGGGLVTTPFRREAAFSRAKMFVAHPIAVSGIMNNTENPSLEQIGMTIDTIGGGAELLHELGLHDDIIEEPFGGAEADPNEMAQRVQTYIAKTMSEYADMSARTLFRNLDQKMQRSHGNTLEPHQSNN